MCAIPATTSVSFSSSRSRTPGSAALPRHALSYFFGYFCTVEGVGSAHRPQCTQSWHDRRVAQVWAKRKKDVGDSPLHTQTISKPGENFLLGVVIPTYQGSRVGSPKHLIKTCFVELTIGQSLNQCFRFHWCVPVRIILITEILTQLFCQMTEVQVPGSEHLALQEANCPSCRKPFKKAEFPRTRKVVHVLCLATHQRHHFSKKAGLGGEEAREAPTKCFHVRSFSVVRSPTT